MKRLLFLGAGGALVFMLGGTGPASADAGPHVSTAATAAGDFQLTAVGAGRCAGCHRTHTAKAALLLKAAQPALCYTCHATGMGAATDIQNGVDQFTQGALRGGGFTQAKLNTAAGAKHMEPPITVGGRWVTSAQTVPVLAAGTATTSRHEIDGVTAGTMWGNGAVSASANVGRAAVTLECGSCHDPHGNGNYRILKPVPTDAAYVVTPAVPAGPGGVPAAVAAVMSTTGVVIPDTAAKVYTTTNYWAVQDRTVPLVKGGPAPLATEADGYIANVSQWCSTCHSRYMAKAPDYETNSGDAVFTYRHTSGRTDKAGVSRPNCIQCHVSHGTNAAMVGTASTYTAPDGTTPAKSSRLLRVDNRGTCVMCHNV